MFVFCRLGWYEAMTVIVRRPSRGGELGAVRERERAGIELRSPAHAATCRIAVKAIDAERDR